MEEQRQFSIKMVIIGDGAVGKTSIAKRYLRKGYEKEYLRTIGADFYMQERTYHTQTVGDVTLQWMIWDLGGQPAFDEVRPLFYRGAKAALIVYDISRSATFYNLPNWINEFWEKTRRSYPFILVANKIDLRGTGKEEIPRSKGVQYSKTLTKHTGFEIPYLETSAKENTNIDKAFRLLAQTIIDWLRDNT